jgi:hypothetical protein
MSKPNSRGCWVCLVWQCKINHIPLISHKEAENMQMKAAAVKPSHQFLRSLGNGFPFPKGPIHGTYALLGPFPSPRRYANLSGTVALCLAKVSASSHTLVPWVAWQCARILLWSLAGILSHFPICSKSHVCLGLVHFLSWKQKKEQYFFERLEGNNSEIGVSSLQWKTEETGLGEVLCARFW